MRLDHLHARARHPRRLEYREPVRECVRDERRAASAARMSRSQEASGLLPCESSLFQVIGRQAEGAELPADRGAALRARAKTVLRS